jgi:hypothetical protein
MKTRLILSHILLLVLVVCGDKKCFGELYISHVAGLSARTQSTVGTKISFCKGGVSPEIVTVTVPASPV